MIQNIQNYLLIAKKFKEGDKRQIFLIILIHSISHEACMDRILCAPKKIFSEKITERSIHLKITLVE